MIFVRGNNLLIGGSFWSASNVQPTSATCTLRYCDPAGKHQTATVNLTCDPTSNRWSGSWDSSAAGPGRVDWVVQSEGALKAAAEGNFTIIANAANNGTDFDVWSHARDEFRS